MCPNEHTDDHRTEISIDDFVQFDRRRFLKATGATGLAALGTGTATADGSGTDPILVLDREGVPYWEALTFTCLQGLVNRNDARLFVTGGRKGGIPWYDDYESLPPENNVFLDWYDGYEHLDFEYLDDRYEVFDRLDPLPFDGYVVIDRNAPETANIAANYASTEDLLPVTQDLLDSGNLPDAEVVYDLRSEHRGVVFSELSRVETYEWALDKQWPETNKSRVAALSTPAPPAEVENEAPDISTFTENNDTIYLKFEDPTPETGFGAQLLSLSVVDDGEAVLEVDPCTSEEQQYLVDEEGFEDQSVCNGNGHRYVNKTATWHYELSGVEDADALELVLKNFFTVSIATELDGTYTELVSGGTQFQETRYQAVSEPGYSSLNVYSSHGIRDYVVAERGFTFNLTSVEAYPDERALKGEIMSDMPTRGYVLGWVGGPEPGENRPRGSEIAHISQISENGQLSLGGATYAANYSFHSRIDVGDAVERFRQSESRPPTTENYDESVYLTFVMSDGDSLNHISRNAHGGQWLFDERGDIPFGWEIQLLLADIAPGIVDYFGQTATENDDFVASASAIGYTFPSNVPEDTLRDHLTETVPYLEDTGIETLSVLNNYTPLDDSQRSLYPEILGDQLQGAMRGYRRTPGDEFLYGSNEGQGTPGGKGRGSGNSGGKGRIRTDPSGATGWTPAVLPEDFGDPVSEMVTYLETLADQRSLRPLFVPIHIPRSYYAYPELVDMVDQLDDRFEVVTPDRFYTLFGQSRQNSVVYEPPEGAQVGEQLIGAGSERPLTGTFQAFGEQPRDVTVEYRITAGALSEPVVTTVEATLPPNEKTTVSAPVAVPADAGGTTGELTVSVDGDPQATVPVTFVELPGEVQSPYETFASTTAAFGQDGDRFVIQANGRDVGQGFDQYGAVYLADGLGETGTVTVTVDSQEKIPDEPSKAGILVRNDMTAAGSPAGDGYVGMEGLKDTIFLFQWDRDDDGRFDFGEPSLDSNNDPIPPEEPYHLKIEKDGDTFRGYYSQDGSNWTLLKELVVESADPVQDVGIFATSHVEGQTYRVELSDFQVTQ